MADVWQIKVETDELNDQFTDVFNKSEYTKVPLLNRLASFMEDILLSAKGLIKFII